MFTIIWKILTNERGIFSSLFGGGSKPKPSPLEKAGAEALREQVAQSKKRFEQEQFFFPLQRAAGERQESIASGIHPSLLRTILGPGVFQTDLPAFERDPLERQFTQARANFMNLIPGRGGAQIAGLTGLERDRAANVGLATGLARQRGPERAMPFIRQAFGAPPSFAGGDVTGAASALGGIGANVAGRHAAQQSALGQGIGGLLGTMLGGIGGGGGGLLGSLGGLLGLGGGPTSPGNIGGILDAVDSIIGFPRR